jgi:hypothetical protein
MSLPSIKVFEVHETMTDGEDLFVFWTGPHESDPEYQFVLDHDSYKKTDFGIEASPPLSKTKIRFSFFDHRLEILFTENGRYIFSFALFIHPQAKQHFFFYIGKRLREVAMRRHDEVAMLPGMGTKKNDLVLVENVESVIGSFLTGKKGSVEQQKQNLKKEFSGGATRRTQSRQRTQRRQRLRTDASVKK